jgi:hypothetical protein
MSNTIERLFTAHPHSVGESYPEHFQIATGVGLAMIASGFACLVHAVVPNLFQRTGSTTIKRLYALMLSRQPHARFAHDDPAWQVEYEI